MNLAEVWEHLEEDTRIAGVSGRVQRRIGPTGRRDFFLGLEMPLKAPHVDSPGCGGFG